MVEIYINNQRLDAPSEGFKYQTTFSIADAQNLEGRKSYTTKTISLPGTNRNRQILGLPEDLNVVTSIDQTVKPEARIEKDGTTVLRGNFKITGVDQSEEGKVSAYKGVILGNNGAWKIDIQDKSLRDLDLSDQDHTFDVATVNQSETLTDSRDYVYPLINYGLMEGGSSVELTDRYPAIRIKRILKQIFQDANYKLVSNFWDSNFAKRLFLPFTLKETKTSDEPDPLELFRVDMFRDNASPTWQDLFFQAERATDQAISHSVNSGNTSNYSDHILFDNDVDDVFDWYDPSSKLMKPKRDGWVSLSYFITLEITSNTNNVGLSMETQPSWVVGTGLSDAINLKSGSQNVFVTPGIYQITGTTEPFFVEDGDWIQLNLLSKLVSSTTGGGSETVNYSIKANSFVINDSWLQVDQINNFTLTGQAPIKIDFLNETAYGAFDDGGIYSLLNDEYTPPSPARVNLKTRFKAVTEGGEIRVRFYKREAGVDIVLSTKIITPQQNTNVSTPQSEITTVEHETGFIDVDPSVDYWVTVEIDGNRFDGSTPSSLSWGDAIMWNEISTNIVKNSTVNLSLNLPDEDQVNFIQWLKNEFNLYFDTDVESRKVYCEPFDDFYSEEVIDWTDKLDLSRKRNIKYIGDNLSRNIRYKYSSDNSDQPVSDIISKLNRFDEYNALSTNLFSKSGRTNIESGFSPTLMDINPTIGFNETLIPKMWNENEANEIPLKNTEYNSRILYYDGVQSTEGNDFWVFDSQARSDYPRMYFYDEYTDNDNNLMFRTLRRSHGLFEKYHRNSFKLFNEGRVVTAYFYLNDVEISNLDFKKKILLIINGEPKVFILSKVVHTDNELSKVELLTDVGTADLTRLTTIDDDDSILPSNWVTTKSTSQDGIYAEINGVIVPVYSTDPITGNLFWVQTSYTL